MPLPLPSVTTLAPLSKVFMHPQNPKSSTDGLSPGRKRRLQPWRTRPGLRGGSPSPLAGPCRGRPPGEGGAR